MATADVDLTVAGGSGTIEGAVFTTEQIQPAGTGVFNTFLENPAHRHGAGLQHRRRAPVRREEQRDAQPFDPARRYSDRDRRRIERDH
jgi:hypothetical protein